MRNQVRSASLTQATNSTVLPPRARNIEHLQHNHHSCLRCPQRKRGNKYCEVWWRLLGLVKPKMWHAANRHAAAVSIATVCMAACLCSIYTPQLFPLVLRKGHCVGSGCRSPVAYARENFRSVHELHVRCDGGCWPDSGLPVHQRLQPHMPHAAHAQMQHS